MLSDNSLSSRNLCECSVSQVITCYSQCFCVAFFIMPQAVNPWILLALSALEVEASLIGTLATAIRTNHLATAGLIGFCALEECRNFFSIRKGNCDLVDGFGCSSQARRVVLVVFESHDSSLVRAACSTTDSTAFLQAGGTSEVTSVPVFSSVGVPRLVITWVVLAVPSIEMPTEMAFL